MLCKVFKRKNKKCANDDDDGHDNDENTILEIKHCSTEMYNFSQRQNINHEQTNREKNTNQKKNYLTQWDFFL